MFNNIDEQNVDECIGSWQLLAPIWNYKLVSSKCAFYFKEYAFHWNDSCGIILDLTLDLITVYIKYTKKNVIWLNIFLFSLFLNFYTIWYTIWTLHIVYLFEDVHKHGAIHFNLHDMQSTDFCVLITVKPWNVDMLNTPACQNSAHKLTNIHGNLVLSKI